MRRSGRQTYRYSEHLRQVEALLEPIRSDRSIDDAERRRLISEVLAAANARALSLDGVRREPIEPTPLAAHEIEARRWQRGLLRVG